MHVNFFFLIIMLDKNILDFKELYTALESFYANKNTVQGVSKFLRYEYNKKSNELFQKLLSVKKRKNENVIEN